MAFKYIIMYDLVSEVDSILNFLVKKALIFASEYFSLNI